MNDILTPMRRRGFTLIETLVALLIVVVVVGGSLTAVRALSRNARAGMEQAEMAQLADESVAALRTIRDGAGGSFAAAVDMAPPSRVRVEGAVVATSGGSGLTFSWCRARAACAAAVTVPVWPSACSGACTLSTVLTASGSPGGEVVAVRRTAPDAAVCQGHATVSLSYPASGCRISTADTSDWTFYVRTVTVAQQVLPGVMNARLYAVTVTVANLNDGTSTLTRQASLTDYDATSL